MADHCLYPSPTKGDCGLHIWSKATCFLSLCIFVYLSFLGILYFLAGHGLVYRLPCFNAWDYEASDAMDTMILSVNITLLNVATTSRCIVSDSTVLSIFQELR